MPPEKSGLGRKSIELSSKRGWKEVPLGKWDLHRDLPIRNISLQQQYQTHLWLPRIIRVRVQFLLDRYSLEVWCEKGSESEVLFLVHFLTTRVSVQRNSALHTSSCNFIFKNLVYMHNDCTVPSSFFPPSSSQHS